MSFIRLRVSGAWTAGTTVSPAEFEAIDLNISRAIDGTNGGAYSLQADLMIGGAPGVLVDITAPTIFQSAVDFFGNTFIGGTSAVTLTVNATSTFNSPVTCRDLTVNGALQAAHNVYLGTSVGVGDVLQVAATATFLGPVHLVASAQFDAPVVFDDDVTFTTGTIATFDGQIDANGNVFLGSGGSTVVEVHSEMTISEPVSFQDAGKIRWRVKTISVAGNQSVVGANYDAVFIPPGVIADGNQITIDDTGAQDGMRIEFFSDESLNSALIVTPSGATTSIRDGGAGVRHDIAYMRVGGAWRRSTYAKD